MEENEHLGRLVMVGLALLSILLAFGWGTVNHILKKASEKRMIKMAADIDDLSLALTYLRESNEGPDEVYGVLTQCRRDLATKHYQEALKRHGLHLDKKLTYKGYGILTHDGRTS